jgi:drug/metabolite transporter (DMT)-like permease
MASFAFLTPIFSVFFGWLVFNDQLTLSLALALVLVGSGIYLVNRG